MLSLNIGKTKYLCFYPRQKNIAQHLPCLTVCDIEIERVQNFNFLGLIINENLSWKSHTDHISNKILRSVEVMNRLKRFLPQHIMKTLYFSLIHSYLNYSALAWGFNCGRTKLLQKKAIRIITNSKYNAHTEPLFKAQHILKFEDMVRMNYMKWYYKYCYGTLPFYFLEYNIRRQSDIHGHDK